MAESIDSQYLTFGIDGEAYAVPVIKVREVLEHIKPTKLPRTADFLKGIINVRGNGIPVVDLRVKFGLPEIPASRDTAILVMEVSDAAGGTLVIGALADEVHEVIELDGEHLESAPRFGTRIDASFISGVGKRDGKFIIVIDIDKVFDGAEKSTIAETADASTA